MAVVLKSESPDEKEPAARDISGLAGFNLSDLADEGRVRIDQCRQQVQQMLQDAKQQADQLFEKAKAEGYQEGLKQAAVDADKKLHQEAEKRSKDSLKLINAAVGQLRNTHQQWMQQYAETLSSIALAASEKVIRQKLTNEPQLLVTWAEDAVRSTRSATQLTLAVHPETLAQLGQALDELLAAPDLPEKAHVEPDESLPPGEVVVRQNGGEIQAGLQAQLDRLQEILS